MTKMRTYIKTFILLAFAVILIIATPTTAYAASVNSKVIHANDISTMELWRYAKTQGWTTKWTEKKLSKTKYRTTLTFENKKWSMVIIQTSSLNSKKKAIVKYYQGKTQTTKAGIKNTLKKYKVKS